LDRHRFRLEAIARSWLHKVVHTKRMDIDRRFILGKALLGAKKEQHERCYTFLRIWCICMIHTAFAAMSGTYSV